jgi:carbon storage regulator
MLVLSRNIDETIMIGDNIRICVVDIQHNRVRLGIEAPQEIPVHRKEIYEAVKNQKLHKNENKKKPK